MSLYENINLPIIGGGSLAKVSSYLGSLASKTPGLKEDEDM